MKSKITFNTKDLCAIYSISAPRLSQIRNGRKTKSIENASGNPMVYDCEPILKKGQDWNWKMSEVVYYMSAIRKLNNQTKKGKSIQKNLGVDFEKLGSDSEIITLLLKHSNIDRKTKLELTSKFSTILNSNKENKPFVENTTRVVGKSSDKKEKKDYLKKIFSWFGGKSEILSPQSPIAKKVKIKLNNKEIILSEKDTNEIIRIIEFSCENKTL